MHALASNETQATRDDLIRDHVDMARRLARKIARRVPPSVGRDELESAALLGLTEAANRYDVTRGEPFVAYAAKRVRGAVLDELRHNDLLTRRGREGARRLQQATRDVEARTGRSATIAEIADELGVSEAELEQTRGQLSAVQVPLDESRDVPISDEFTAPDAQLERRQRLDLVRRALETLGERDLQILSMHFQDGLTLKEIGTIFGVSESRISQLRTRALGALRREVQDCAPL